MRTTPVERIAGVLVGLEGVALAGLAAWQVLAIVGGDIGFIESAIALVVLTVVGAVAVLAFGVAVVQGRSWGRSGGIVTQVLILAVALGAATGAYAHPLTGLALAVPALVTFALLVLAARNAGRAAAASEDGAD